MTVQEALAELDALKPNDYSIEDKLRWLSRLDASVRMDILDNHVGAVGGRR